MPSESPFREQSYLTTAELLLAFYQQKMRCKMNEKFDEKTGEIKSTPRFVHSMDFDMQALRLKAELAKRVNDEYIVHTEDYENINDMVRRCIITKTKFKPESNPLAHYDSDDEIAQQLPEYIDQTATPESVSEQETAKDEQSEVKAGSNSDSTGSEQLL